MGCSQNSTSNRLFNWELNLQIDPTATVCFSRIRRVLLWHFIPYSKYILALYSLTLVLCWSVGAVLSLLSSLWGVKLHLLMCTLYSPVFGSVSFRCVLLYSLKQNKAVCSDLRSWERLKLIRIYSKKHSFIPLGIYSCWQLGLVIIAQNDSERCTGTSL